MRLKSLFMLLTPVTMAALILAVSFQDSDRVTPVDRGLGCRFALDDDFGMDQLLYNKTAQNLFIDGIAQWEARWHRPDIAYGRVSGLTLDARFLNEQTGELTNEYHNFSAPSKESWHMDLLSLSILGDRRAQLVCGGFDETIAILKSKVRSYIEFDRLFPGYGGFLPWFSQDLKNGRVEPVSGYWEHNVPALDNGEWIMSIYNAQRLLARICKEGNSSLCNLANEYETVLQRAMRNVATVFYDAGAGKVSSITFVRSNDAAPTESNFQKGGEGYLVDAFEGEVMTVFISLFSAISHSEMDIAKIWSQKVVKRIEYGPFTQIQQGWHFSSHEQDKLISLPYVNIGSKILDNVFSQTEMARTLFSAKNSIPGMLASCYDPPIYSSSLPSYDDMLGVPALSSEPDGLHVDVVASYATFPTLLLNRSAGLVWLRNTLMGPGMQTIYGISESCGVGAETRSTALTWDGKMFLFVPLLGGTAQRLTVDHFKADGLLDKFRDLVEGFYSKYFSDEEPPINEYSMPTSVVPRTIGDYPNCIHG